jgi:hypothetical protein
MDDSLRGGLAQIPHGNAELSFRRRVVSLSDDFTELANLGSDARLHAPIAGALLDILTVALDG